MRKHKILTTLLAIVVIIGGAITFILTHPPADLATQSDEGEERHGNQAITTETIAEQAERTYLEEMIPHHQEAIDSSKQMLERSSNADVKRLAEGIIAGQEKEIADMKTWYKSWYGVEYTDTKHTMGMMRDLSSLNGSDLDRAFMEDMIEHHTHALEMGQAINPNIQHEEIRTLAVAIADTQAEEIITMRILLKQL